MPPSTKSTKSSTTPGSDPEGARIVSLTALADRVEEIAAAVMGGGDVSRESDAPGSLEEQVTRAVQLARQEERQQTQAEQEATAVDDRIKALEERTEKKPVERSRLSKWMWGEE